MIFYKTNDDILSYLYKYVYKNYYYITQYINIIRITL